MMIFGKYFHTCLNIGGAHIALLNDGFWFRVRKWKDAGYWITWSAKMRFGERFGYELPIWQVTVWNKYKGMTHRIACFKLEEKELS